MGMFGWPLPVRGIITSRVGPRWGRNHDGVDIAVPTGTRVLASAAGKVVTAGWFGGYGNCVDIKHDNGFLTRYGHNSSVACRVGEHVRSDQLIAHSGSTGRSTGPHLHFEMHKNGAIVNPLNYTGPGQKGDGSGDSGGGSSGTTSKPVTDIHVRIYVYKEISTAIPKSQLHLIKFTPNKSKTITVFLTDGTMLWGGIIEKIQAFQTELKAEEKKLSVEKAKKKKKQNQKKIDEYNKKIKEIKTKEKNYYNSNKDTIDFYGQSYYSNYGEIKKGNYPDFSFKKYTERTFFTIEDLIKFYNSLIQKYQKKKNFDSKYIENWLMKVQALEVFKESQDKNISIEETEKYQQKVKEIKEDRKLEDKIKVVDEAESALKEAYDKYNQSLKEKQVEIGIQESAVREARKKYYAAAPDLKKVESFLDDLYAKRKNILERINNFDDNFSNKYMYWNKSIIENPQTLNFWLEFLDSPGSELGQYSIPIVGDRAKADNDTAVTSIYFRETPQVIFYSDADSVDMTAKSGYVYVNIPDAVENYFTISAQGKSAKDVIDENLYNYGYCVEEISFVTIPIYYLEPNEWVSIYDKESHIEGEYVIRQMTIQLAFNGTMSVNATKLPRRLY